MLITRLESRTARYGVAVLLAMGSVGLRWLLVPVVGLELPLLPLVPGILMAALIGGAGPGLVATAISLALGSYLFMPPLDFGSPAAAFAMPRMASFVVAGVTISVMSGWMLRMLSALEANRQELQASQERFRLFMEHNPTSSWIVDRGGTIRYASKSYYRMFPVPVKDLAGVHCSEVYSPELSAQYLANNERVFASGEVLRVVESGLRADGSPGEFLVYKFLLPSKEGEMLLGGVAADITDRRQAEAELRIAKEAAEAASRTKDHFIAALSHELRNPLNPVLLIATEMLANSKLDPEAREAWEMVNKNVSLEAALIDDLLDLTRVSRGKMALSFGEIDAHAVVRDALETVRYGIEEKRLAVATDLTAQRSVVRADAVRLQQIFWNVLSNAVKFTPVGGAINVRTRNGDAGRFIMDITDTGIGMTEAELSQLFGEFSQGEHAQSGGSHRFGGLGLGMAITRELVKLHEGRIHAASAGRGRGAVFTIDLPVLPVTATAVVPAAKPSVAPLAVESPSFHILLVEDHEPTRSHLARLLTRRGHSVTGAGTVAEARAAAETATFDLLVSDIGLPDGDGHSLMRELKAARGAALRGIAISGYGTPEDSTRSREAGFAVHLTKPIPINVLDAALRGVTAAPAEPG